MYMNTDMYIYTYIYMYIYMCVLWCRVMSCVARRWLVGWLGGWVGGWVWCGDVRIVFLSSCRPVVNLAVTPPSIVAVVLLVSCSRLVVAVSSCGGPCLKSVLVSEACRNPHTGFSTVFQRVAHQTHTTDTTCTRTHNATTHNITRNITRRHSQRETEKEGRERERQRKKAERDREDER